MRWTAGKRAAGSAAALSTGCVKSSDYFSLCSHSRSGPFRPFAEESERESTAVSAPAPEMELFSGSCSHACHTFSAAYRRPHRTPQAASMALSAFPTLNASLSEDRKSLLQHPSHNIGVAMDTSKGLLVPCIASVEEMSVLDIAEVRNTLLLWAHWCCRCS